ncbi:P-loop containing nucleoside triphosphate hydrolase protein, partial [Mycena maculata]
PSPQIFHGREFEYKELVNMLKEDGARVAILGPGGIGKTSLAAAVLHHPDIVAKYAQCYFISCQSTPTCAELVSNVSVHIGYETPQKEKTVIQLFAHSGPSLLVLDNFETPWESSVSRSEVESFLAHLAGIPHLSLMITMRGAERPGKVKWTRPFLGPLEPLTDSAALQTFIDIADVDPNSSVQQLLELTGNIPLAVTLVANVAAFEGCDNTLSRWSAEGTHLLSDGFDKKSSLDISIMLSVSSSRMTDSAQELLGLLSLLPDGLSDVDLVQSGLPIPDILSAKATLIRTSLAMVGNGKRLKLLAPIREYAHNYHPPSDQLKIPLRMYFHRMLELWHNFENVHLSPRMLTQVWVHIANIQSLLSDALQTDPDVTVLQGAIYLDQLTHVTNYPSPSLMLSVVKHMAQWQMHPVYGQFLISIMRHSRYFPTLDTELHISDGTKYFQNAPASEQGNRPQ